MHKKRDLSIEKYNADAWDHYVKAGIEWTIPVTQEQIEKARKGDWSVTLATTRPVPRDWFPEMKGADVLCLAGGGGQQGPIFAAAGANVTVLDSSSAQLERDRMVAGREGLNLTTVQGDMRDLSCFEDESFDLVFHPVANCYVPEILPIWHESYRVLRPGGILMAGLVQPIQYIFDFAEWGKGRLIVKNKLPYNDLLNASDEELAGYMKDKTALEFSHYLEESIGGQMEAGFVLTGFFEDRQPGDLLSDHIPVYFATRALKMVS